MHGIRQYYASHGVDYRFVMPTNLYDPGDNYHPENSHVIPALLRKFHEAKSSCSNEVTIWGTGTSRREFLYVDDMATACVFAMNLDKFSYDSQTEIMQSYLNVGFGSEVTIEELAQVIARATGYHEKIIFDTNKPDGAPRKWINSKRLNSLDWHQRLILLLGCSTLIQ